MILGLELMQVLEDAGKIDAGSGDQPTDYMPQSGARARRLRGGWVEVERGQL